MRLVIITRMKIKTMGITAFQSLLLTFRIWKTISIHIFKHHHPLSICLKPHITRMCSFFLRIIIRKILSRFQTSASFTLSLFSSFVFFSIPSSRSPKEEYVCTGEKAFHQTLGLTSFIKMVTIFKFCILLINFLKISLVN